MENTNLKSMSFENFNFYLKNSRLNKPVVFRNLISSWPAQSWTPTSLIDVFGNVKLMFRVGKKNCTEVQYEPGCQYVSATIQEFNEWSTGGNCSPDNPLSEFNLESHWCYADYKHLSELFPEGAYRDTVMRSVDWSTLGFTGRNGEQSTFWLGTRGAYTVCHYDTYGCNLVAQIHGRKRWMLYPPSQTNSLYPTRIPYEESSVFSQVNIKSPDYSKHHLYKHAIPYEVVLEAGDLLFVPHLWWHFVENLETSISVNTWIELGDIDDQERIKEAVTRVVAHMIISQDATCDLTTWLNPTEVLTSHTENLNLVQSAVLSVHQRSSDVVDRSALLSHLKRNTERRVTADRLSDESPPLKKVHIDDQTTTQYKDLGEVKQMSETLSEVSPPVIALESLKDTACSYDSSQCYPGRPLVDKQTSVTASGDSGLSHISTDVFISAEFEALHMKRIYPRSVMIQEPIYVDGQTKTDKGVDRQTRTDKGGQKDDIVLRDSFTSADLAAVLLHPDVIDVVYSKIVDRFNLP